jgi:Protein of unknown function (DUF1553)/Protein of unknown function (DUF1549)/Planctomycete cytochrome C
MSRRILAWTLAGVCLASLSIWHVPSNPDAPAKKSDDIAVTHVSSSVEFSRDILPILSSKCYACHGPDAGKNKLRLDLRAVATKPRKRSGETPIVPGDSAHSEVVRRIFSDDPDERMPPNKKRGKELTAAEKNLLKRWIDEGAEYQPHWAFSKITRPKTPTVKYNARVRNDIDAFILHRLEAAGLTPSPAADRVTLIRRLSLDLRGLPPSLAEIDEFLADNSADAYEKLVDRMLASPHYGEKMAMLWLDLARFGDTSGYHMDSTRQMSLWRDWVIDAFNQNMPFDQFTIEQLAGDLLPGATDKQKIASGFNRNTRFNEEGGVDPEEYVIRYNIDRTNTLGQVWLGMTLGCAECHSHKYDPISHHEYYQLFAYFTGINEPMLSGPDVHGKPLAPILRVPTPEQAKDLAEERRMMPIIENALVKELARIAYTDPLEGKPIPAMPNRELVVRSQLAWEVSAKGSLKLPNDVYAVLELDAAKRDDAQKKRLRDYYLRKVNEAAGEIVGPLDRDLEERAKKVKDIEDALPYTLISEELAKPRPAFVLLRGDFTKKGDKVERGVPAIFPPVPTDAPNNRLGLARWLVRPDHPLTARVAVNRLWAQMFGNGIVHTIADFGTQGDLPSHPELLDWLAAEFLDPTLARGPGWDVKRILRTIALSATYRQSSAFMPDGVKRDPQNRLLSRMPRFRLSAEELRDSALSIAGLINPKVGGPSFMPYQPPDFYKSKNEEWPWNASTGDEQYRRGMYAFWRRTALHPMFAILDAPNREECTAVRPRTNTPLQALVTLNDPSFVEAARVFAEKIMTQAPKDVDGRLTFAFRRATGRQPSAAEMNELRLRYQQQHVRFHGDAETASKLVNAGQYPRDAALDVRDLAAWTAMANMLLNLDEVLTRE